MYTVREVIDQLMKIEDKSQILYVNIPGSSYAGRESIVTPKFDIGKGNAENIRSSYGKLVIYPLF